MRATMMRAIAGGAMALGLVGTGCDKATTVAPGTDTGGSDAVAKADGTTPDGAGGEAGSSEAGTHEAGPGEVTPPPGALEVQGVYASKYGEVYAITEDLWGDYGVVGYDNQANWCVAELPKDDPFNPGTFSKLAWTEPDAAGAFWYCTVDFGLATAAEAAASTKTADPGDLDGKGCGGFPWTQLEPTLGVHGTWANAWNTETYDAKHWATSSVVDYDNDARWAVTQSPPDDAFNPNAYSKVVWTPVAKTGFAFCFVVFGQSTAEAARTSTAIADEGDLDGKGCGGFPWTRAWRPIEIAGTWTSDFGDETIDSHTWASTFGTTQVVEYDNVQNVAYTQNAADDQFNPSKFNKVVWTDLDWGTGAFYYCVAAYGQASLEAAKKSDAKVDAADPAVTGCGGFPWSKLSPK